MKYIEIGDLRVPALGYGTWQNTGPDCREGVIAALEYGYRHIDTAQAYENEREIGAGIKEASVDRKEIFLTTKIWMSNVARQAMEASFAESLAKLETDYVDLLLLHWPVEDVALEEQIEALVGLLESGQARSIGVSNYPVSLMERAYELSGGRIVNNQIEYHPFISQKPVLEFVRSHNMFATAYSPLARGKTFEDETLGAIARKHGKSPSQIALRWLVDQDRVAAIPKASKVEHMKANMEIFDFTLDDEDRKEIDGLRRKHMRLVDPSWAPEWDEADRAAA